MSRYFMSARGLYIRYSSGTPKNRHSLTALSNDGWPAVKRRSGGRLIIPILDDQKQVVNVVGYSDDGRANKPVRALNDRGLFNAPFLSRQREIVVAENPIDALLLIQSDIANASFPTDGDIKAQAEREVFVDSLDLYKNRDRQNFVFNLMDRFGIRDQAQLEGDLNEIIDVIENHKEKRRSQKQLLGVCRIGRTGVGEGEQGCWGRRNNNLGNKPSWGSTWRLIWDIIRAVNDSRRSVHGRGLSPT